MVGWMAYLLSSLLTIVLTAGMISAEVEAGTFAVIVPKPLSRAEIVLGKWLGYALIVAVYTALLFLSFLAVIYWQSGYWPPQVLKALGTLELETMTLLAITTLGSSLILFIGAPISSVVQFIVQAISQAQDQAMQNIAITINLIVPTDALWHGTSFYLLPSQNLFAILGVSTRAFNTPFTSAEPLTAAFLVWAVLYSLILPTMAVLRFQRRDL
jgi:ABC-type transport system involved in multi-copper enzyme maturation permease subunit